MTEDWSSLDDNAVNGTTSNEKRRKVDHSDPVDAKSDDSDVSESSLSSDYVIQSTPEDQRESSSESSESSDCSDRMTARTPAKFVRQSALDSLIKKRKLSSAAKQSRIESELESSESDSSESDGISSQSDGTESSELSEVDASDSESSYSSDYSDSTSSESSNDPSFYLRINQKLNKRDKNSKGISESLSSREAFVRCMQFYALELVDAKNSSEILSAGVRKTEEAILSHRNILRPSYWRPDDLFVRAIESYPEVDLYRFRKKDPRMCKACGRSSKSFGAYFRGEVYDSGALWEGDLTEWKRAHGIPVNVRKPKLDPLDRDNLNDVWEFVSGTVALGSTCVGHTRAYHALTHIKSYLLERVLTFIRERHLTEPEAILKQLELERDGIVEQWYEKYQRAMTMSEEDYGASYMAHEDDVLHWER